MSSFRRHDLMVTRGGVDTVAAKMSESADAVRHPSSGRPLQSDAQQPRRDRRVDFLGTIASPEFELATAAGGCPSSTSRLSEVAMPSFGPTNAVAVGRTGLMVTRGGAGTVAAKMSESADAVRRLPSLN